MLSYSKAIIVWRFSILKWALESYNFKHYRSKWIPEVWLAGEFLCGFLPTLCCCFNLLKLMCFMGSKIAICFPGLNTVNVFQRWKLGGSSTVFCLYLKKQTRSRLLNLGRFIRSGVFITGRRWLDLLNVDGHVKTTILHCRLCGNLNGELGTGRMVGRSCFSCPYPHTACKVGPILLNSLWQKAHGWLPDNCDCANYIHWSPVSFCSS